MDLNYTVTDNLFKIIDMYSPTGVYPSDNLYPSDDLYPDDIPYDYLILKFKVYQDVDEGTYDVPNVVTKYTNVWYIQAIPLEKRGNRELIIKYERG